jgi:hypothetical protein
MGKVVKMPRKVRPLQKTYRPSAPYVVERSDDDYSVIYEVMDERPESHRIVCFVDDDEGRSGYAKHDAEQIARALNFMVQCGKEALPNVPDSDD